MNINYWYCDYSSSDEINMGTEDNPDYEWHYGCTHPSGDGLCRLDNKYSGKKDDCKLLDL